MHFFGFPYAVGIYVHNIFFSILTDALLKKAFASPSFQGYSFVSSLLVLLGLIKVCFILHLHISHTTTLYVPLLLTTTVFPVSVVLLSTVLLAAQSEDKVKPVLVVPGHLHALEHVVRQDYFPKESVAVLEAFMSR